MINVSNVAMFVALLVACDEHAPPTASAHVAFLPNKPGGAWTFWIGDYQQGFKVSFEDDCVPVVEAQP